MVRAYRLPRVELWENLALQFYTDGRGARLLVRVHGSDSLPFKPHIWHSGGTGSEARSRIRRAAAGCCCPAPAASSAHPIVCAGALKQRRSGMFGPRSAVQRVPRHKGPGSGWRMWGLTAEQRGTAGAHRRRELVGSVWM